MTRPRRLTPLSLARSAAGRIRDGVRLTRADVRLRGVVRAVAGATRSSDTAAVVHLHYPEVWAAVADRLDLLPDDVDVYVTMTDAAWSERGAVLARCPRARVIRTPNVGRDVLPFIRVAAGLRRAGYSAVLKLHGKRSVHADDGAEFLDACLTELLPSRDGAAECRRLVTSGELALVGPESRLYPLAIHVWWNIDDLRWFFRRWRPDHVGRLDKPTELSFFAGTMFWARLDAIADCLDVPTHRFAVENAQIDGTMAHALERLFGIVPEVDGEAIGVSGPVGQRRVAHDEFQWPEWALRKPEWE
ncbi:lipopolysaccharide biosynthesis protein [Nocardioides cavernae]|uniref:Lipopolysaccharide biosynthesis protein n=1 Tax=Nocardioides cavernae TaxID=1921566 RepID=A0A7Y9H0L3_9ACTN|nr:rhamnan synthesis F family protein [Nocardioides cavernae]NYE35782.1 lipopolysaccharide biosynthesis protein [Nocardioides cavernae]